MCRKLIHDSFHIRTYAPHCSSWARVPSEVSATLESRLGIKGSLRIDGRFQGEALVVDQIHVGADARVKTNITATSVVVEGVLVGNVTATARILLLATARVVGDITTPELIIQDGVVLVGRCTISHQRIDNPRAYVGELLARDAAR